MKKGLNSLSDYFDAHDLGWKPVALSTDRSRARVVPYISNRAIMDRLDTVCGPENWRNEFRTGPAGGILCGLSIRVVFDGGPPEWVTKWDGAENTEIQPVKGGITASMRRAAVQWGIGRYLYRMPSSWAPVDERGKLIERPSLPARFRPHQDVKKLQPGPQREAA
jgi:hypothetical protein